MCRSLKVEVLPFVEFSRSPNGYQIREETVAFTYFTIFSTLHLYSAI